jgi:superfamily I DNA and/or RNA helicase
MPHTIGTFISREVYGGKLLTRHLIKTSKACRFIDVNKGLETKAGHSWIVRQSIFDVQRFSNARQKNREEAHVIVKLAQLYKSRNMPFRIITPYDAQRSHIENLLKREKKFPWEDKVFNVDSFQGSFARKSAIDRN